MSVNRGSHSRSLLASGVIFFLTALQSVSAEPSITIEKVAAWRGDASAAYSIVHDDLCSPSSLDEDGIYQHYGELTDRNLRASFAAIVKHCDEWKPYYYDIMDQMISEGHEVVNHSYIHSNLTEVNADWDKEIDYATQVLREHGLESVSYIFPFDSFNDTIFQYLTERGYLGARGGAVRGVNAANMNKVDPLAPFRARFDVFYQDPESGEYTYSIYKNQDDILKAYVDDAISQGGWAVRELHGIEDDSWGSVSLSQYRTHLDYVSSKIQSNQLWMDTFSNIIRYRSSKAYCGEAQFQDGAILFSQYTSAGCVKYATNLSVIASASGADSISAIQNNQAVPVLPISTNKYMLEINPALGPTYIYSGCGADNYSLPSNSWNLISLPCDLGVNNTVTDIFGATNMGQYGVDWILYRYDAENSSYVLIHSTDTLNQGIGYWIIQTSGALKTLQLPGESIPTRTLSSSDCYAGSNRCFEIELNSQNSATRWNLVGYPFTTIQKLVNSRIVTESSTCKTGCAIDIAASKNIAHNKLWSFTNSRYRKITSSDNLEPWLSYWSATLGSAGSVKLLIPQP